MSLVLSSLALTQPFSNLVATVNTIIQILANQIVTANGSAGWGSTTTGNGFVFGVFGANTVVAPLLQGGNVASPNTVYLMSNINANSWTYVAGGGITVNSSQIDVGSNIALNTTMIYFGNSTQNAISNSINYVVQGTAGNTVQNSSGFFVNNVQIGVTFNVNVQTSGLSAQVVDSFLLSSYRAAKYFFQITDNTANNYQVSEVSILHAGGAAESTEYGILISNNNIGSFSASVNTTSAILSFTPSSTNTQVKGIRTTSLPV